MVADCSGRSASFEVGDSNLEPLGFDFAGTGQSR